MASYLGTDKEFQDIEYRLPLLLAKIKEQINKGNIICLQEIDSLIVSSLHKLFIKSNYYCITSHFSSIKGRKCWGILTAFPTKLYTYIESEQVRIGDLIEDNVNEDTFPPPDGEQIRDHCPYQNAQSRDNRCIRLVLSSKQSKQKLTVYNYHMPCAFYWPTIMTLHLDALLGYIDQTRSKNFILAGDFNILYKSPHYSFIKGYNFDKGNISSHIPSANWVRSEFPELKNISRNTDTTMTKNAKGIQFNGKLDYIFTSSNTRLNGYQQITCNVMIPNETEPSDHVLIEGLIMFD
jgi:endonuclease/exonuclease/phosphatase family metal-dependent hydrolase